MSDLVYQNYNNKCQGWVNPSNIYYGPQINSLSGFQSPAGSNTVVSIIGTNFYSYSTIRFGTFNPTAYFINTNLLQFYVPNTLSSGTFPVQVFNGSVPSNIVNYTIDNASGYWLQTNNNISNTNGGGVIASWISRGAPVSLSSSTYSSVSNAYNINSTDNWIICNTTTGPFYINLPSSSVFSGREIMIKRIGTNSVINTSNNIYSLDGTWSGSTIMDSSSANNWIWVTLVFDGINWITMQAG